MKKVKDTIELIGTKLDESVKRDAIHIAVIPALASVTMRPGTFVNSQGQPAKPYVGVVDPFLTQNVLPGERFFIFLMPKTITSLRHVWSHPAFPEETPASDPDKEVEELKAEYAKPVSERWLREFASSIYMNYETLIAAACGELTDSMADVRAVFEDYGNGETYLCLLGTDAHGTIPDEFWHHLEVLTGKKISQRAKYFTCSC